MNADNSGTTATVCYRNHATDEMFVAHCGDSRAILITEDKMGNIRGIELTPDHKPNLPAEKERIESSGGYVHYKKDGSIRVAKDGFCIGLNMSRAIGDLIGNREAGITEIPDVKVIDINIM